MSTVTVIPPRHIWQTIRARLGRRLHHLHGDLNWVQQSFHLRPEASTFDRRAETKAIIRFSHRESVDRRDASRVRCPGREAETRHVAARRRRSIHLINPAAIFEQGHGRTQLPGMAGDASHFHLHFVEEGASDRTLLPTPRFEEKEHPGGAQPAGHQNSLPGNIVTKQQEEVFRMITHKANISI
jgi:hypothetical protein